MDNEQVAGTSATSRKKAQKEATVEAQFVVKTKGYNETFRTESDAQKQYDFLKKRSVKSQEPIKIELCRKDENGNSKVLENVSIGGDFFN